jgi:hypothetical protein
MIFLLCVDFFTWNTSPSSAVKDPILNFYLTALWHYINCWSLVALNEVRQNDYEDEHTRMWCEVATAGVTWKHLTWMLQMHILLVFILMRPWPM